MVGRPIIRWVEKISPDPFQLCTEEEKASILADNPGLYGYYCEGAPAHLINNVNVLRKLGNGQPLRAMHSIEFSDPIVAAAVAAAYRLAKPGDIIDVPVRPEFIHCIVNDECAATVDADLFTSKDGNVLPFQTCSGDKDFKIHGVMAAKKGLVKVTFNVHSHHIALGFALTDYKFQGGNYKRIIVNPFSDLLPHNSLEATHVGFTRVQTALNMKGSTSSWRS